MADDPACDVDPALRVSIMTTTHYTLSTQRSSTIAEANGRATLYLTSVSMSLVALGFIAQATELGAPFYVFAYVLLGCLVAVGALTFDRVVQTGVEDGVLARGEARVRRFYRELDPSLAPWFILPIEEEGAAQSAMYVGAGSRWQILLTAGSMIGVVNATLAGALTGLATAHELGLSLGQASLAGAAAAAAVAALQLWRQTQLWKQTERA